MSNDKAKYYLNLEVNELAEQLNNAMDIAHLGMFEWDIEKDQIHLDHRCYEITGIDAETFELTMKSIIDNVIHKDSRASFIASLTLAKDDNVISNNEYRLNHPDKQFCWVKFMSRLIKSDDKVTKFIGVIMDVTGEVLKNLQLQENAEFISELIENIPSPIFYKDVSGLYRHFNKAFEDFIGLPTEAILDKSVYDISPDHLAKIYEKADNDLIASKGKQVYESLVQSANGNIKNVIFKKTIFLDPDNNALGIIGIIQDVTEQRSMEKKLSRIYEAQKLMMTFNKKIINYKSEKNFLHDVMIGFSSFFEKSDVSILLEISDENIVSLYDVEGSLDDFNDLKVPFDDSYLSIITKNKSDSVINDQSIDFTQFKKNDPSLDFFKSNPLKSSIMIPIKDEKRIKWYFIFSSLEENTYTVDDEALAQYIKTEMTTIIHLFTYVKKTQYMANHDGLTGLYNRSYIDQTIKNHIDNHPNQPCHIILADLDYLKKLNDVLGHDAGDHYLRLMSSMMDNNFGEESQWGRIGGDEFVGLVSGVSLESLFDHMEEIRQTFKSYIVEETDNVFHSSFSYGIASYPKDGLTYKVLLKCADERMYIDKKQQHKL